ncbi:hypothetical protein J6590_041136 [Homalodisca vitripennis]|nr:hypothetical protein J6590_041136 [Homalodisca vitripennis]
MPIEALHLNKKWLYLTPLVDSKSCWRRRERKGRCSRVKLYYSSSTTLRTALLFCQDLNEGSDYHDYLVAHQHRIGVNAYAACMLFQHPRMDAGHLPRCPALAPQT